jgi:hypothetical protein
MSTIQKIMTHELWANASVIAGKLSGKETATPSYIPQFASEIRDLEHAREVSAKLFSELAAKLGHEEGEAA